MSVHPLIETIRAELASHSDAERAAKQQQYMKSAMPFYGVGLPQVRKIVSHALAVHPLPDYAGWRKVLLELWEQARYREERYAALAVGRHRKHREFAARMESLALYEELIRQGAWWDLVDEAASHLVSAVLQANPDATEVLRRWSREEDLWVRRSSIIAQLGRRDQTDLELLQYCIAGSVSDSDFFARKAIGWALRDYAYHDPDWVRNYLARTPELSPLSRREAAKHLD